MRFVTPIGPEEEPIPRIDSKSSWLKQSIPDQDPPMLPVQVRDFNGVASLVAPVEVPSDPVDGQPIGVLQRRELMNFDAFVGSVNVASFA